MEMDEYTDGGVHTDTLIITPEVLNLIAAIDEFKGAWAAIGRIAPGQLTSLRRVATIESIGSSTRIEGARLTDVEVERLLAKLNIKDFASRDEQEVAGYAQVMELVSASWSEITLTENHIKHLHRDLLKYSSKDQRHCGDYKTLENHIEAFGPVSTLMGYDDLDAVAVTYGPGLAGSLLVGVNAAKGIALGRDLPLLLNAL